MPEPEIYYATYCDLDIENGGSMVKVDGNVVVVGSELTLVREDHVNERGKESERIVLGRGDQAMGFLPENVFRHVAPLMDKGWTCRAFAAADVFDKRIDAHHVLAAVICYAPADAAAFGPFVDKIAHSIAKGEYPVIDLSAKAAAHIVDDGGASATVQPQKLPKLPKGTAYYKTKCTATERLVLAAADGNKGCYAGLAIVTFVIIFAIVWFLFLR